MNANPDSLLSGLLKAAPDTAKVNRLFSYCLLLDRAGATEHLISLATEAGTISRQQGYVRGMGIASYVSGFYHYAKRAYVPALNAIGIAATQFEAAGDPISTGRCLYLRANMLYDTGNYAAAVDQGLAALQAWEAAGFSGLNSSCCNDLALAYGRMGNYSKGVEYAYRAFQAAEKNDHKSEMAQALHLTGSMFYEFRNYENAMKNFRVASELYTAIGDQFGLARNNNMIGEILLEEGKYTEALNLFSRSLEIYALPGAPAWGAPWGYSNTGSVYEKQGDSAAEKKNTVLSREKYAAALKAYTQSMQQFEALKDPAGTAEQVLLIGTIYFKTGQLAQARKFLLNGLAMSLDAREKKNLAMANLYLSRIDSAEGNTAGAYARYKMYVLYKDSIFNMQNSQNLSLYRNQLEMEKKDHEIELLATENKLNTTLAEKQNLQKKVAYGMIGAVLLLGAYGFYRFRRYNRIRAEKKLLKERLAISQDLHDHVGSTLSSIAVFSKVAQVEGEKGNTGKMNELLDRIRSTSGRMMTEMNDIVWAINPQNDTMAKIIQRMELFAKPLLTARNIQFDFRYDESVLQLNIGMENRKNFYLLFKEAINNAIKYSGASLLEASISYRQPELELQVKDNGVGFNMEKEMNESSSLSGNGLKNMKARAREMNAILEIHTAAGRGTVVQLKMPVE